MHMTQHQAMLSFARGTTDAWGMAYGETYNGLFYAGVMMEMLLDEK